MNKNELQLGVDFINEMERINKILAVPRNFSCATCHCAIRGKARGIAVLRLVCPNVPTHIFSLVKTKCQVLSGRCKSHSTIFC